MQGEPEDNAGFRLTWLFNPFAATGPEVLPGKKKS